MGSCVRPAAVSMAALALVLSGCGGSDPAPDGDGGGAGSGAALVTELDHDYIGMVGSQWCGGVLLGRLPEQSYVELTSPGEGAPVRHEVPFPESAPGGGAAEWTYLARCVATAEGDRVALTASSLTDDRIGDWIAVLDTDGVVVWSWYDDRRSVTVRATDIRMSLAEKDVPDLFLDPLTGTTAWALLDESKDVPALVTTDGSMVLRTDQGWQIAPKKGGHTDLGTAGPDSRVLPTAAGLLLLDDEQAALVDPATGERQWLVDVPGLDATRHHVDDIDAHVDDTTGTIVVELPDSRALALSGDSGELLWQLDDLELDGGPDGLAYAVKDVGHGQVLLVGSPEADGTGDGDYAALIEAGTGEQLPTGGEQIGFIAEDGYVVPKGAGVEIVPFRD